MSIPNPRSVNSTAIESAKLVVAIVNYCTPHLCIDCLASLEAETRRHPGMQVVVADNGSPDGSGAVIKEAIEKKGWTSWARLLQLPRNGGFAYGNNAVLHEFQGGDQTPEYFWLLNSDTVVLPGATQALVDVLAANPTVGIVGSCLVDPDGTQQYSAFRFPTIASEFEASARVGIITRLLREWMVAPPRERKTARYDWLSGASMMIRREVIRDVGPMDERYFLYYEETDYCRRATAAGWACFLVEDSEVIHLVGRSTGVTDPKQRMRRRSAYWFDSRRRYFVTHYGRLYAIAADLALGAGTVISACRAVIRRDPSGTPRRFLLDLINHSALRRISEAPKEPR
jgi:N-acetylglucosaminyl-diphospho-decaprenol L-rhamnosyltransferase